MQCVTKRIDVSSSYRVVRHTQTITSDSEFRAIRSGEICRIHSAIRESNGSVTLVSSDLICPYCNFVYPLTFRDKITQVHINTIKEWTNPQMTIFPQDMARNKLHFFSADPHQFGCPRCGKHSDNKKGETTIWVQQFKKKMVVRCKVQDLRGIFELPYLSEISLSIDVPFYEEIEFNFRNGHTCLRIVSIDGEIPYIFDVTNAPYVLNGCELSKWFYKFDTVKALIQEGFSETANAEIPLDTSELSVEDFVFYTRFIGYDASFYNAIPYDKETLVIDKSFRNLKRLRTPGDAVAYFSEFSFSRYASLRKQIYEQPGFLFFLPECEALYNAIKDVNVFRNMLKSRYAFDILITLHQYPTGVAFFRDYCRKKGAAILYKKINSSRCEWHAYRNYMVFYSSMSKFGQEMEQKKWMEDTKTDYLRYEHARRYSLPMVEKIPEGARCELDGFVFKPLYNTAHCFKTGKELQNCLQEWNCYNSIIIAIYLKEEVIAAFEIWRGKIEQAHTYKNGRIDEIEGLPEAIEKWAKINKICCSIQEIIKESVI